ncbi:MAG TPA: CDP-alcohol phosphatidyltransferase family protein [Byssovorax sp.]
MEDRSFLLPYYQRWLVKPLLPLLPASLNPNTITHAGHLMNCTAACLVVLLWPQRGPIPVIAALLLNAYCWCDNADGAHARRTNQCSPMGEFLDHGLDQLNTVYMGYLTAYALGASPIWWVAITLLIPGAAVVTYWEQAATGVMRLGRMNQVESVIVLSSVLVGAAVLGVRFYNDVTILGVPLGLAFLLWSSITIVFGMVRAAIRVASARGAAALLPIAPLVVFDGIVFGAAALGVVSTVAAVAIATGGTVYFGMQMLTFRLHGERPRVEKHLLGGAVVGALLIAWRLLGGPIDPLAGPVLVTLAIVVYGALAILAARSNVVRIGRMAAPAGE